MYCYILVDLLIDWDQQHFPLGYSGVDTLTPPLAEVEVPPEWDVCIHRPLLYLHLDMRTNRDYSIFTISHSNIFLPLKSLDSVANKRPAQKQAELFGGL